MSRFSLPKLTPNNYQSWSSIISCYLVEEGVSSSGDNRVPTHEVRTA